MSRLNTQILLGILITATWMQNIMAYKVNTTLYDTNSGYITYSDAPIKCNRWTISWLSQPVPVEEDRWRYRKVVMHDTHPMLSYSPAAPSKWVFWRSASWSAKVHITEDGTAVSWHEFKSNGDGSVETNIRAGAVAIYGVPSAYIDNRASLGYVCVQLDSGPCDTIDLKTIYANQKDIQHEPVLLWQNNALDPSCETHVIIRSVKMSTGTATIFPFKSIHYLEEQEYSSPRPPVGDLKNVTIEHDSHHVTYNPGRRCESYGAFGGCNSWFNPWTWKEAGPLGSVLTYRSTISQYRVKEDPHITLSFSGSAVYLYGAPVAYAARPFAPQHVCINNACRVIDVEQAYLHPPREDMESTSLTMSQDQSSTVQEIATSKSTPHPELEPVLIWSTTGLNDKVEHTLQLALASLPASDNAEMSIVKIVYTHVTYGWGEYPPKPPAPGLDHAYAGPLQPPYAKWAPLAHEPSPPTSIDRPSPGQSPLLPIFAFVLLMFCCFLTPILGSWRSKTWEAEPLLSLIRVPYDKHLCYLVAEHKKYRNNGDKPETINMYFITCQNELGGGSVADPVDDTHEFNGIRFSHVVYTNDRPTPWPVEEDHWRYREVVMHDTHPLLSYAPTTPSGWLLWKTFPWSAKVHTIEDGPTTSWHEIKSHNEGSIETKIRAGAVAVYGAPSAYIENRESLGSVCIRLDRGLCETVNLKTVYANQRELVQDESKPILLWRNDRLDPSRETRVSIQLVKASSGAATTFPFKSINYLEEQEYSSPQPLTGSLWNVTVNHDDRAISYNPQRRCIRESWTGWCETWFDPWAKKEIGPSGSILTYRSTLSKYRTQDDPHITLSFRGSAAYLYGVPAAYAARPFAPQHVCINNMCRVIDAEQAYLHLPGPAVDDISAPLSSPHPELEPVLIWATTGLNDQLEHTLRLALAPLPSRDDAVMTIVKVVYTQANGHHDEQQDSPAPKPDHAYAGPLHPPYATAWTPLDHKPLPPISTDAPRRSPSLLFFAFVLFMIYRCLPRALRFWHSPESGSSHTSNGYIIWPDDSRHIRDDHFETPLIIWGMLMMATQIEGIVAHRINTTIYDTNSAHVTYSDMPVKCNRWSNSWVFWKACDSWLKPWESGVYRSQGKQVTFHSSLNHQLASTTIEFKGTDVWVYGPPLSRLTELPPDYKICLHESYYLSSKYQCYQINITKAYSATEDEDEPVLIFSRGQLQGHQHRIVISVADPVDSLQAYNGIQFSHVIYTTSRPTPWPVKEDHWRYRKAVIHDTHPLLSYSPQSYSGWFSSYSPWSAKVRTAEDGAVTSWHELEYHNEKDQEQWGIDTKIKAGAVAVY
ncbi:unnamed protein product [Rhizoctonia solani]|uniref:Uncharacterized protein n=1 Tax=Rhizoctonia solani TaxID=456999 RepID=A0A8H3ATV8_9AGAM|nr:unnamed protein product [Rhizoctonia solani]